MIGRKFREASGQGLVEFSLAILIFLVLMMAVFDFGRAIYQYNGVAQAAREIARVTASHQGTDFTIPAGRSPETVAVIATQAKLIPNLQDPVISCTEIDGTAVPVAKCIQGDFINVYVNAPYTPITPLMGLTGTWNLFSASTSAKLQ